MHVRTNRRNSRVPVEKPAQTFLQRRLETGSFSSSLSVSSTFTIVWVYIYIYIYMFDVTGFTIDTLTDSSYEINVSQSP